jgi:small subunit ribosomal protein S8
MTVTDSISDMLTRIRNAIAVRHDTVEMPCSHTKESIANILKQTGFIANSNTYENDGKSYLKIKLSYREAGEPAITGLKRMSKPSLRVYFKKGEVPRFQGGSAMSIVSTSKGVMTGKQAWKQNVGGELLCYIW